jgi:23S rRNA (uracil1939-C5)-methyltransferase
MSSATVTCTSFAYGGQAIARLPDGRAVFVPFALPGETVRVRLVKEKAGYAEGELIEVLSSSSQRVAPRCRHYRVCGGCHYQHLDYPGQLAAKAQIVRDQLVRLGGLIEPPVAATVPSPNPWHYRNHMQFHRTADGQWGLQAARSHELVPISECHLPAAGLERAWRELTSAAATGVSTIAPERVSLRIGNQGIIQRSGGKALTIDVLGRPFQVSSASFFQVNTALAGQMVEQVLAWVESGPSEVVIDLYCGVGLFSAFLAPRVGALIAVESSPAACADFADNLSTCTNMSLHRGSAEEVLPRLTGPVGDVVADPPRAGLGKAVVEQLLRLAPHRLIYISCNPATLARDARQLVAGGYQPVRIIPFDLFPQTYHIESVSLWEKRM